MRNDDVVFLATKIHGWTVAPANRSRIGEYPRLDETSTGFILHIARANCRPWNPFTNPADKDELLRAVPDEKRGDICRRVAHHWSLASHEERVEHLSTNLTWWLLTAPCDVICDAVLEAYRGK